MNYCGGLLGVVRNILAPGCDVTVKKKNKELKEVLDTEWVKYARRCGSCTPLYSPEVFKQ